MCGGEACLGGVLYIFCGETEPTTCRKTRETEVVGGLDLIKKHPLTCAIEIEGSKRGDFTKCGA